MSETTPADRLARVDTVLDRCRDRGNVRLAHLEMARNELAKLVGEHSAALYELERLRAQLTAPDGICGTTFGVEQAPMFICTLPRGHFPDGMHKNAGGTAWLLDSGVWTIQRGPAWVARLHDEDPQQPERGGAE